MTENAEKELKFLRLMAKQAKRAVKCETLADGTDSVHIDREESKELNMMVKRWENTDNIDKLSVPIGNAEISVTKKAKGSALGNHMWRVGLKIDSHEDHIDVLEWPPLLSLRIWKAKRKLIKLWKTAKKHEGEILLKRKAK